MASYSLGNRRLLSHAEDLGHGGKSRIVAPRISCSWVNDGVVEALAKDPDLPEPMPCCPALSTASLLGASRSATQGSGPARKVRKRVEATPLAR
jgi:hypothetical protein